MMSRTADALPLVGSDSEYLQDAIPHPADRVLVPRLVFRISAFMPAAIRAFDQAVTWTEIISGLLRMQLLTDFLRRLLDKKAIDDETYMQIHLEGNQAINGRAKDPFSVVMDALEKIGLSRSSLKLDLEMAVANSSVISYLLVGRPETILIDDRERVAEQLKALEGQ